MKLHNFLHRACVIIPLSNGVTVCVLPISGTPPGSPLSVYVADTGRPHCLYHNGIKNGALPAFPIVLGTTKSQRGTGQGCMGDDLRHRANIFSDIPVL